MSILVNACFIWREKEKGIYWSSFIFSSQVSFKFACNAKNFTIAFFSLSFSFLLQLLGHRLPKFFLQTFQDLSPRKHVTNSRLVSLDTKKVFVTSVFQDVICYAYDSCNTMCCTLFTVTRIHSIPKITKMRNSKT